MNSPFILLTQEDGKPILIGISSISTIEPRDESGTRIMLSFARGKDMYPKVEYVKESFEQVKAKLFGEQKDSSDW